MFEGWRDVGNSPPRLTGDPVFRKWLIISILSSTGQADTEKDGFVEERDMIIKKKTATKGSLEYMMSLNVSV